MKTLMQGLAGLAVVLLLSGPATAGEFAIGFEWGRLKLCNTGRPNTVSNPRFRLSNVPAGTRFITFRMTDLDVPSYNHGGGTVRYTGQRTISPGAFRYRSPCPPGGTHTYQWTAVATDAAGGTLATATASRPYP